MKKVILVAIVFVSVAMIVLAADFRQIPELLQGEPAKKTCQGFTIIEFDKGVDCHGDTINLVRSNGFAQKAPLSQH